MPTYMGFEYSRIDSGIRIDKYIGSASSVNIPARINNLSVTSIEYEAFSSCSSLSSIGIPNSVTKIGSWAFNKCSSLKSIVIPDSVTSIGYQAFYKCSSLKSIYFPKNLVNADSNHGSIKDFLAEYKNKIHYYDFPSRLFGKIFRLESSLNISNDMLNRVKEIKNSLLSGECNDKIYDIELILDNLITTYELQQKILNKIFHLECLPNISYDMLDSIQKLKKLFLSGKCTDKIGIVDSILDNFTSIWELQQNIVNNPLIKLVTLINSVSEEKIINAPKYVQKFNDEIVKIEADVKKKFLVLNEMNSATEIHTTTADEFKHSLIQSGIQIDKYIGRDGFVFIPEQLQNLPVTTIGYRAFDNENLNKVVIPASVKTIVYGSFISKQPLHVFFKGSDITLTPQSFIAPEVVFYFDNSAIAKNLYVITQKNPRCKINYDADSF